MLVITPYHSVQAVGLTFTIRSISSDRWAVVDGNGRIVDRCVTNWDAAIRALRLVEANHAKSLSLQA